MAKLKIKNFGPIKDGFSEHDGFMEISPVTVICGNQATGKSTIAKLYSTLSWLEKDYVRNGLDDKKLDMQDFVQYCKSQRLHEYFTDKTEIEYIGYGFKFKYENKTFDISKIEKYQENYNRPKIMYVPAERNLITVIEEIDDVRNIPPMLSVLLDRYNAALKKIGNEDFALPISNLKLRYDTTTRSTIIMSCDSSISVNCSSSGVQSIVPLSVVSKYLSSLITSSFAKNIKSLSANEREEIKNELMYTVGNTVLEKNINKIIDDIVLTGKEKQISTDEYLSASNYLKSSLRYYFNTCFINIVEEPEQNLYPESQRNVLFELLECMNTNEHNKLLITTHSPYIISYLTLASKAAELLKKGVPAENISKIVPEKSAVGGDKIRIYETHEDGSIKLLEPYEGLPSDDNLLNNALADGNEDFSKLLDLEETFCK